MKRDLSFLRKLSLLEKLVNVPIMIGVQKRLWYVRKARPIKSLSDKKHNATELVIESPFKRKSWCRTRKKLLIFECDLRDACMIPAGGRMVVVSLPDHPPIIVPIGRRPRALDFFPA